MSFVFWLQPMGLRLSVCFKHWSLNRRRMSPAQTITTEWTAEKCSDKRQTTNKRPRHKLGNRTNRWSKVQADARFPSCKKQFKQQWQHCRLKDDLYSTYESRENLDSFSLSILSEISQTEYGRQRQISKEKFSKNCPRIVHFLSNMQNVAILRCCFSVTFCKQRRRNEQRITTHAYTAIVLVAVAVKLCLIKLPAIE